MGRERDCIATIDGARVEGRALLETEEIVFRSKQKPLHLRFSTLKKIEAKGEELHLDRVVLHLGADAAKWAHAIANPKGRIEKLGVKPGQKVAAVGVDDTFLGELRAVAPELATTLRATSFDVLFFGVDDAHALARLPALKAKLAPAGALWIVRPKGSKSITESAVRSQARDAGLVDVKVVKFSETHTAEKFVIPVADRR
jgi:hypothetical protein